MHVHINQAIAKLNRKHDVYVHTPDRNINPTWRQFQEREKAFWKHKITSIDYCPDPLKEFTPFLGHWGIEPSFFKDKTVLEVGSGPFGFFAGLAQMDKTCVPKDLVIVDPLMDYYQQFNLSKLIPEHAFKLQAVGENIPLPVHGFDIILTTNTLDHVKDCDQFLAEIHRLLKPKGLLLLSVHTIARFIQPFRVLLKIFDRNHPYHFSRLNVRELLLDNSFLIKREVIVRMHKENPIPNGISVYGRMLYYVGFRIMSGLYAVAEAR